MTAPAFAAHGAVVSAVRDAPLILTCPSGDQTGNLLVAIVASYGSNAPATPVGWSGPVAGSGIWLFLKQGASSDAGASVLFPARSTSTTNPQDTGVIVAYANAVAIDVVSAVTQAASSAIITAPQIRTSVGPTAIVEVFAATSSAAGAPSSYGFPATSRVAAATANTKLAIGVSDQAQTTAGKSTRVTAANDYNCNWRALTFALRLNVAPNPPNLTSPVGGVAVDATQEQLFTWTYSDPDAGDTQSAYEIEITTDSTFGTVTFTGSASNSAAEVLVLANTFTVGDTYYWRVRTTDPSGNVSDWSSVGQFVAQSPPAAPTITTPTPGETIASSTLTVAWTAIGQTAFEVRRVADNAGSPDSSTVYFDSFAVTSTAGSYSLAFDTTGRAEHVQVRVQSANGLWSTWADVLVNVAFTPPGTPVITVTGDDTTGSISVAITNTTGAVAAVSNDIYRRQVGDTSSGIRIGTGLPLSEPFVDWLPTSGIDWEYQAVAVADDGATTVGAWINGDASLITVIFDGGTPSTAPAAVLDGGSPDSVPELAYAGIVVA